MLLIAQFGLHQHTAIVKKIVRCFDGLVGRSEMLDSSLTKVNDWLGDFTRWLVEEKPIEGRRCRIWSLSSLSPLRIIHERKRQIVQIRAFMSKRQITMTSNNRPAQQAISNRWHSFWRVCATLRKITHHALRIGLKLLAAIISLLCAAWLVLRFVVLPQIGDYKPHIESMLDSALGRSISISQISGSWQGLRPHLELQQVIIRDEQGRNAVVLPKVELTVAWSSLFLAELNLYSLKISQPELELKRSADGKFYFAGWWMDPKRKSDARGLDWILSQRSIVINNGTLKWTDQQRKAPVLTLSNMNFVMKNRWRHHQFSLTAVPPTNLAGPLDIRADFTHHPFSNNSADFLQWKGTLYSSFSETDLAAWKSFVDYPFEIQRGAGAMKIWFAFDRAKIVDITAELKLTDVNARLRADLQPLDLKNVSGRISAQELTTPTIASIAFWASDRFRHNGHQITLTDFTFESRSGLYLPPTTLTERFIPANQKNAEKFEFSTKLLDLTVLAKLTEYFPLPQDYKELLQNGEPAGQLANFSVKLEGKFPEIAHYQLSGGFSNLAMKPQTIKVLPKELSSIFSTSIPGFTNLTGHVDIGDKKGSIQLNSKNVLLNLSDSFSEPEMGFDLVDVQANWLLQPDNHVQLTLTKFNFHQQDMETRFYGTANFSTPLAAQSALPGTVDLTGTISKIDVQKVHHYLPAATDPSLRHWLTQGLLQGSLANVSVRVKGQLAEFPFEKKGLLDQNIFRISGKIVDGKINYLPGEFSKDGVTPYWPILSKINGQIVFDRQSMDIHADSGETDGVPVAKVHARIPDYLSNDVVLEIDGTASGTAQEMLHYLSVSPVLQWIDNFTQDTKMSGNAKLKLRLAIPLAKPLNTKVAGEVQLKDNDVALLKELPVLTQVNGRLNFDEHGLNLNTMKGNFLGSTVTVVGGTQKDGVIRIKAEGHVTADGVRKAYGQPALKNVLAHIDGRTSFTALIQVKNKRTDVWVDSTMQGMALGLPAPLNKKMADKLPLHVEVINSAIDENKEAREYDEMKLSLGSLVNTHYLRQRASRADSWKVISGGIGINAPAPTPDSGLSAHLELGSFNVGELWELLSNTKTTSITHSPSTSDLSATSTMDLYQYIEPNLLSVHAVELVLMGKKLNQVTLGATRLNSTWQANIDSKQISGHLTWDNAKNGLDHVTARLASLIIPDTAANDVVDLLQDNNIHSSIPGLDVVAENVEVFNKKFGRLELLAKNVNTKKDSNANEWQIDSLTLTNPDAVFTAKGKWINDSDSSERANSMKNQTNLTYQLTLTNAGKLLDRLGYTNLIAGGNGKLNGIVRWNGSPYSMDLPSLSGHIQLDLNAGQFLKVDPGAAKLLAVLNLQALPRLLMDFRDVFSDGFSFDGITGAADIEKGIAKTDNFNMHGASATVLLSGTANINDETQDLHVIVVPEIDASAASIVYGLAVNPMIGAGTFLAQLFLKEPLMKAFTFEYQVTGPWKDPKVVELKTKR